MDQIRGDTSFWNQKSLRADGTPGELHVCGLISLHGLIYRIKNTSSIYTLLLRTIGCLISQDNLCEKSLANYYPKHNCMQPQTLKVYTRWFVELSLILVRDSDLQCLSEYIQLVYVTVPIHYKQTNHNSIKISNETQFETFVSLVRIFPS